MPANNTSSFLASAKNLKILVIGDLMIDQYLWGSIDRISPEAPVPVVDVYDRERRLGGAANAALNLKALGATPVLCGVTGKDKNSLELLELARKEGFDTQLIFSFPSRKTTVKTRIICNNQHVMRVDDEDRHALASQENTEVMDAVFELLTGFDAIIFSDYDKGMLSETLISMLTIHAEQHDVPVIVDPKFKNFHHYPDCNLFKPNLKELNEGLDIQLDKNDLDGIALAVEELRSNMPHRQTLVTLSENGMLFVDENLKATHLPAYRRNIVDVSGAGDTVAAVLCLGIAAGLSPLIAAKYANLAGGLVCEEVGVVPIDPKRLVAESEQSPNGKHPFATK